MIKISNTIVKKQENFWSHCLFHPTDAVEDPWGRRILDRMAADKAVKMVRIYTMFEDIVYIGENGELQFDYRVSDLRLDYLVEKGYDILLAYAGMPDCIARSTAHKSSISKNKTRYKGKMFNTAPPKDYALWEEICYDYTRHIVERYGIERVSSWRCHCFNEPDLRGFFLSELPQENVEERCQEYCKLYEAFEKGVRRVSDRICIGGPALAGDKKFFAGFLDYCKNNNLKLDYLALHNYGTGPSKLNQGDYISVEKNLQNHQDYMDVICAHGFGDTEVIIDEWGAATAGFFNREECPALMFRETEVFSAYFAKLIHEMIERYPTVYKMMICLSGQHEMVEDFSGFRNFFTLNFIAKPIYNAYILASKLGENLLHKETENENIFVVPTKNEKGDYAVLLSYSSDRFEEDIPEIEETVEFTEGITGKKVTVWCIDKNTTNPYRLYQKMGIETPTDEEVRQLQAEGRLKPVREEVFGDCSRLTLKLTANSTFLITVTEQ